MSVQESINSAIGQAGLVAGIAKGATAQEGAAKATKEAAKATKEATANAQQAEAIELEDKLNQQFGAIIQSEDAIKGNKKDIKQYKLDLKTAEGRLAEMESHFVPDDRLAEIDPEHFITKERLNAEREKVNSLGLETKDNIKRARDSIKYLKNSIEIARKRQNILNERLKAIRGGNE